MSMILDVLVLYIIVEEKHRAKIKNHCLLVAKAVLCVLHQCNGRERFL